MTTNTGGGTTTSLNNTPQAKDDFYTAGEDEVLYFSVMANDLGGNAKVLWSVDNSSDDGSGDLVARDVAGVTEYSELGAKISLTSDGRIKYDTTLLDGLAAGQTVTDQFTYAIRMSNGTLSWATVTVTLTGTNDGPVAVADVASGSEDTVISGTVAANDSDVDAGAVLGFAVNGAPPAGFAMDEDGNWTLDAADEAYQHIALGATEEVVVSYTVTDEHGASATSTLTITITGTNDGPVASADTGGGHENETLLIDVLANDDDVDDGAVLTVVSASAPAGQGTASVVSNQVQFDPGSDFDHLAVGDTAIVSVSYTIEDQHGASSSSTIEITVTGTNDGPVANADTGGGHENETLLIDVLANDDDVDDGAVLAIVSASAPAGQGTASIVSNQVQFDPGTDFDHLAVGDSAVVTVSYTIEDEHGASSSSTVEITVTGTNDGPVANADTGGGHENETLLIDVLANDDDVDDGAVLTVIAASAPAGQGTASVVSNQVQFDPGTDFDHLAVGDTAIVTVSYTIEDEHGAASSSTIEITVTGTNDGPIANADTGGGHENETLLIDVLANDDDVDDGAVLTVTGASAPAGQGSASVVGNQVQFDPGADFDYLAEGASTTVTVSYTIEDEHGASSSSTIEITVTGANDAAVITQHGGWFVVEDDVPNTTTGLLESTDVDGDDNSFVAVTTPTISDNGYGTFTLTANGDYTYTLDNDNPAVNELHDFAEFLYDSFTVTAADGTSFVVNITIFGNNDPAVIAGTIEGNVTEATPADPGDPTASGSLTSTDVDDAPDEFFAVTSPAPTVNGYGTFTMTADGTWTYNLDNGNASVNALNAGDTLSDSFVVHSIDGTDQLITVTIHGANDAIVLPPVYPGDDDPNNFDDLLAALAVAGGPITVSAGNGQDTIHGSNANPAGTADTLSGGNSTDTIYGHDGNDIINGDAGPDMSLYGQRGNDVISGGTSGDDIYGGSGDDIIYGLQAPAGLGSADGSDSLYGGSGNDTIYGQNGSDTIVGGFGADVLTGGGNSDRFVYLDIRDTGDTITDYTPGPDTLDFSAIDADPFAAGNQQFLWGGTDATALGMWFAQVGGDTILYADTDGNAATAEFSLTLENFSGFAAYGDPGASPPMTWLML